QEIFFSTIVLQKGNTCPMELQLAQILLAGLYRNCYGEPCEISYKIAQCSECAAAEAGERKNVLMNKRLSIPLVVFLAMQGAAVAADLATQKSPPAPSPAYSWDGVYV